MRQSWIVLSTIGWYLILCTCSILPTPAFATATGAALTAKRRGLIKLIPRGGSQSYYLSRNRHAQGYLLVQTSSENALEVEYHDDGDLTEAQTLYIPDVSLQPSLSASRNEHFVYRIKFQVMIFWELSVTRATPQLQRQYDIALVFVRPTVPDFSI